MSRRGLRFLIGPSFVAFVGCAIAGCGDGSMSAGLGCTDVPCGGDIVGSWSLKAMCIDKSLVQTPFAFGLELMCPDAVVNTIDVGPAGTLMFEADGTYGISWNQQATFAFNVPMSCLAATTCAGVATSLMSNENTFPSVHSATCTGSGTCDCTVVEEPESVGPDQGTYTVSGNNVVTTSSNALNPERSEYCARGGTLMLRKPTPTFSGFYSLLATKLW